MKKIVVTDYTFDSLDIETEILQPLDCKIIDGQCKTPAEVIRGESLSNVVNGVK